MQLELGWIRLSETQNIQDSLKSLGEDFNYLDADVEELQSVVENADNEVKKKYQFKRAKGGSGGRGAVPILR